MEEKILIKGTFSKFNILSIIFCSIGISYFIMGLIFSISYEDIIDLCIGIGVFLVCLGVALLLQHLMNNCSITVTDKRVFGKAAFSKRVDLPFDKISSVATCAFKGVGVATSSGRIKFLFCKNKNDVFETISKVLLERQSKNNETIIKQEIPQSNADELKKFKDLLDSGVITQEEFDQKKKQLLGL